MIMDCCHQVIINSSRFSLNTLIIIWAFITLCFLNMRLYYHGYQQTLLVLQNYIDIYTNTFLMDLWVWYCASIFSRTSVVTVPWEKVTNTQNTPADSFDTKFIWYYSFPVVTREKRRMKTSQLLYRGRVKKTVRARYRQTQTLILSFSFVAVVLQDRRVLLQFGISWFLSGAHPKMATVFFGPSSQICSYCPNNFLFLFSPASSLTVFPYEFHLANQSYLADLLLIHFRFKNRASAAMPTLTWFHSRLPSNSFLHHSISISLSVSLTNSNLFLPPFPPYCGWSLNLARNQITIKTIKRNP